MEDKRKIVHEQIMMLLNDIDDIKHSQTILIHNKWSAGLEYLAGQVLRYEDKIYRCLQSHTSQEDWSPAVAPSLWTQIMYKNGIRIIPEIMESTQAFALDEIGWWGDELFQSLMHGNVFTPPTNYPQAWKKIEESLS